MAERVFVAVRIRPLLSAEVSAGEQTVWATDAEGKTLLYAPRAQGPSSQHHEAGSNTNRSQQQQQNAWAYDRVFGCHDDSAKVYKITTKQLVDSTLKGYHGAVFAYGQTGAGKTFTIAALTRMAVDDIFAHIAANPSREFLLRMSAMEIYNEEVRDMLAPAAKDQPSQGRGAISERGGKDPMLNMGPALKVMEDPEQGGPVVDGLREEGIQSAEHLQQLLHTVESKRQVRDTRMNTSSSRSHQIVRIIIESRPASRPTTPFSSDGGAAQVTITTSASGKSDVDTAIARRDTAVVISTISFVDLAGSERHGQAGNDAKDTESMEKERKRHQEASSINKSLLTLGSVIRALGEESGARKHIPYRDSKLTRILQPCLAGNARMAIITTISPLSSSADNTRAALHFANAAKRLVLKPQINEIHDDKAVIKTLQAEIESLKRKLAEGHVQEKSDAQNGWQEKLDAKEEEARRNAEQAQALQKRLRNMERLILRGGQPMTHRTRLSLDGSMDLSAMSHPFTQQAAGAAAAAGGAGGDTSSTGAPLGSMLQLGVEPQEGLKTARRRHPAADPVRASWNPSRTTGLNVGPANSTNSAGSADTAGGSGATSFPSTAGKNAARGGGNKGLLGSFHVASRLQNRTTGANNVGGSDSIASKGGDSHKAQSLALGTGRGGNPQLLFLDLYLPPQVRKSLQTVDTGAAQKKEQGTPESKPAAATTTAAAASSPVGSAPAAGGGTPGKPHVPKLNFAKLALQNLQVPLNQNEGSALAALQAEVHCMSSIAAQKGTFAAVLASMTQGAHEANHSSKGQRPSPPTAGGSGAVSGLDAAIQHLEEQLGVLEAQASKLDGPAAAARSTLSCAVREELQRLTSLRDATAKAQQALATLQARASCDSDDSVDGEDQDDVDDDLQEDSVLNGLPQWMAEAYMAKAEDDLRSASPGPDDGPGSVNSKPKPFSHRTSSRHLDVAITAPAQAPADCGTGSPRDQGAAKHSTHSRAAAQAEELRAWHVSNRSNPAGCGPRRSDESALEGAGESDGPATHVTPYGKSRPASNAVFTMATPEATVKSVNGSSKPPLNRNNSSTPPQAGCVDPAASTPSISLQSARCHAYEDDSATSDGCTPSLSISAAGHSKDSTRLRAVLHSNRAHIKKWFKSQRRLLRSELAARNADQVAALQEGLKQLQDTNERLETQKKLLLTHVLRLELQLEEEAAAKVERQEAITRMTAELDKAKGERNQAMAAARAAAFATRVAQNVEPDAAGDTEDSTQGDSQHGKVPPTRLSFMDIGNDAWESQQEAEKLLPRIIELWHELSVPLEYRSRFYLGVQGREAFYFEEEHRRRDWQHSQIEAKDQKAVRELQRTKRRLDWERKSLASALRDILDEDERVKLFEAWGIDRHSKERKLQLANKIWSPATLDPPKDATSSCPYSIDGALRSSQLVIRLLGMDTTQQLMQLVYGWRGDVAPAGVKAPSRMGTLVQRLKTPRGGSTTRRGENASSLQSLFAAPASPTQSNSQVTVQTGNGSVVQQPPDSARSVTSALNPFAAAKSGNAKGQSIDGTKQQPGSGTVTPRRASFGSLLSGLVGRQKSNNSILHNAPSGGVGNNQGQQGQGHGGGNSILAGLNVATNQSRG